MPAFGAVGCGIATAIVNWAMCLMMMFYSYTNAQERSLKVFSQLIEMPNPKTLKKTTAFRLANCYCTLL